MRASEMRGRLASFSDSGGNQILASRVYLSDIASVASWGTGPSVPRFFLIMGHLGWLSNISGRAACWFRGSGR